MKRVLLVGLAAEARDWLEAALEGVEIESVTGAPESLASVGRAQPDVLVLEHRLGAGTGAEVLRALAAAGKLHDVPVVYCLDLHSDVSDARTLVTEYGVRQILIHPIEPAEIVRQVARLLGVEPRPTDVAHGRREAVRSALASLWDGYREMAFERVAALEQAVASLRSGALAKEQRRTAAREAHKLAGSVGTFGFMEATRLARQAEGVLLGSGRISGAQVDQLAEIVAGLRRELAGEPVSLPAIPAQHSGRRLLVLEGDRALARRIAREAVARGCEPRISSDLEEAREILSSYRPDVAVVELSMHPAVGPGPALIRALDSLTPPIPVLVLAASGLLANRLEANRLGARVFLEKPVTAPQVLDEVEELLQRMRPRPLRVLAIDDDPQVLATLQVLLRPENLDVTTLSDPLLFWPVLENSAPDLLILDIDMPHLSGPEMCRVVRDDPRWKYLPVLFLTGKTGAQVVEQVFAAGADDFINKPIVGPDLVMRIRNRLERVRLYRDHSETDALTGLATRRKVGEQLEQLHRLALRHRQPICFALLEPDGAGEGGEWHGHAARDRVLARFAERLRQAFRGEDVVGRWGEGEFVVGMYGSTAADGMRRLGGLLAQLGEERPAGPDPGAPLRFRAGVVEFPREAGELAQVGAAAEEALQRARAGGSERVFAARVAG